MGPRMDPINGGVRAGRITCRLSKWGRGPHRLSKWDPEVDTSPRGVSSRRITCRSYRLSVGGPRSRAPADTLGVARGLEVLDAGFRQALHARGGARVVRTRAPTHAHASDDRGLKAIVLAECPARPRLRCPNCLNPTCLHCREGHLSGWKWKMSCRKRRRTSARSWRDALQRRTPAACDRCVCRTVTTRAAPSCSCVAAGPVAPPGGSRRPGRAPERRSGRERRTRAPRPSAGPRHTSRSPTASPQPVER